MNNKTFRPALALPMKPTEDIDTAIIRAIPNPITPIPPAVEIRPFFSGLMPLPPSVNSAYKIGYIADKPRLIPVPELERFKREAAILLARSSRSYVDWPVVEAIRNARQKTPLAIRLQVYFPTEWKRDLDNVIKYSIDAACEFLTLNDNQVVRIEADKLVDASEPRIEIEVRCLAR